MVDYQTNPSPQSSQTLEEENAKTGRKKTPNTRRKCFEYHRRSTRMTANIVSEKDVNQQDPAEEQDIDHGQAAQSGSSDTEDGVKWDGPKAGTEQAQWDWNEDPHNPYNWPSGRKAMQVGIIASIAFVA